jgi:hypothetical protein
MNADPAEPLASQMQANDLTRLRGSIGLPVLVVNTSPVSVQALPSLTRSVSWLSRRGGERALGETEQWQVTATGTGLDRADVQFTLNALDLLTDMDRLTIDIYPAQAKNFASSHAVQKQQDECRIQRFVRRPVFPYVVEWDTPR